MKLIKVENWYKDGNDCSAKCMSVLIYDNDTYKILVREEWNGWADSNETYTLELDLAYQSDAIKVFEERCTREQKR